MDDAARPGVEQLDVVDGVAEATRFARPLFSRRDAGTQLIAAFFIKLGAVRQRIRKAISVFVALPPQVSIGVALAACF
jgi:hypothetical protein